MKARVDIAHPNIVRSEMQLESLWTNDDLVRACDRWLDVWHAWSTNASADGSMPNPASRSRMASVDNDRTLSVVQPAARRRFIRAASRLRASGPDLRAMLQPQPTPVVYQLRVVLHGVRPLIWRRLLVRSDSIIADVHRTLRSPLVGATTICIAS